MESNRTKSSVIKNFYFKKFNYFWALGFVKDFSGWVFVELSFLIRLTKSFFGKSCLAGENGLTLTYRGARFVLD